MLHKFLCCSRCGGSPAAPTQFPPPGVTDRSFSFFLFLFPFFVRVTSKSKAPLLRTRERGFCCEKSTPETPVGVSGVLIIYTLQAAGADLGGDLGDEVLKAHLGGLALAVAHGDVAGLGFLGA